MNIVQERYDSFVETSFRNFFTLFFQLNFVEEKTSLFFLSFRYLAMHCFHCIASVAMLCIASLSTWVIVGKI